MSKQDQMIYIQFLRIKGRYSLYNSKMMNDDEEKIHI